MTSPKSPFPYEVKYSQVLGTKTWTSFEGPLLPVPGTPLWQFRSQYYK